MLCLPHFSHPVLIKSRCTAAAEGETSNVTHEILQNDRHSRTRRRAGFVMSFEWVILCKIFVLFFPSPALLMFWTQRFTDNARADKGPRVSFVSAISPVPMLNQPFVLINLTSLFLKDHSVILRVAQVNSGWRGEREKNIEETKQNLVHSVHECLFCLALSVALVKFSEILCTNSASGVVYCKLETHDKSRVCINASGTACTCWPGSVTVAFMVVEVNKLTQRFPFSSGSIVACWLVV